MKITDGKIKHICFDLDGTLVESRETIYKTTVKALSKVGINTYMPEDEFNDMIGMHFIDMFERLNVDLKDFDEFIGIYKRMYFEFINESKLYPGVEEILSYLSNGKNIKVSLLTTKGQDQAEKIITHFKLDKYFDYIMGRREGVAHKPSAEPLQLICKDLDIETKETMMVGDTELDIGCGKNAGAYTCAVSYGYRTKESLRNVNPDFLIDNLNELQNLLNA